MLWGWQHHQKSPNQNKLNTQLQQCFYRRVSINIMPRLRAQFCKWRSAAALSLRQLPIYEVPVRYTRRLLTDQTYSWSLCNIFSHGTYALISQQSAHIPDSGSGSLDMADVAERLHLASGLAQSLTKSVLDGFHMMPFRCGAWKKCPPFDSSKRKTGRRWDWHQYWPMVRFSLFRHQEGGPGLLIWGPGERDAATSPGK